jgi:hypothetical protein
VFATILMLIAALAEIKFGIAAEMRSLESSETRFEQIRERWLKLRGHWWDPLRTNELAPQ